MAIRMQQRRGTSEQWTLANPILAPGEIGFETDENRFKIGDGINRWNLLPYFTNSESLPEIDLSNYVTVENLEDAIAEIPAPDYTGLATETYVDTAVSTAIDNLVDVAPEALDTLNELAAALGDDENFATTITNSIADKANSLNPEFTLESLGEIFYYPETSIMFPSTPYILNVYSTTTPSLPSTGTVFYIDSPLVADIPLVANSTSNFSPEWYIFFEAQDSGNSAHNSAIESYLSSAPSTIRLLGEVSTTISSSELSYLDGVTSNIQDQLDSKALATVVEEIGSQLDDLESQVGNLSNSQDPQFLSGSGVGSSLYTLTDPTNRVENFGLLPPGAANWHFITPPASATSAIAALGLVEDNFTVVISGTGTMYDGTWDGFRVQSSPTRIRFYGPADAPQSLSHNGFTFEILSGISQKTISSAEIRQLDGLKGSVQGQLDATQRIIDTRLGEKANIESPTFTGLVSGNSSATSTAANGAKAIGFKGIPLSNAGAAGAYTIVASDAGEMVYTTTTRTVTIPATASVPFEVGTSIVFVSGAGATTTIGITADNLILAGSGATGSRTLAPHGMATAVKVAATTWYISGNGLT